MPANAYVQRDQPAGVPPLELTGERTLPDVPATTHKVFFALDGSTINFASSSTRQRNGNSPVDTDKLLH